jgi:hypothetical protein
MKYTTPAIFLRTTRYIVEPRFQVRTSFFGVIPRLKTLFDLIPAGSGRMPDNFFRIITRRLVLIAARLSNVSTLRYG